MDKLIGAAIVNILKLQNDILTVAISEKAKIKGWFKFEFESYLERIGM
ncbi:hypothetical protein [Sporosalibacterium faouarense]|nr:hypothetical protein [Sporosalibacterium faouarense]